MVKFALVKLLAIAAIIHCAISIAAQPAHLSKNSFNKADSIASLYPEHSLSDIKDLSDKLTQSLSSDTEKFRAIYRWVCNNIENDYGFYIKNKKKREKLKGKTEELKAWNKSFGPRVFKKLVNEHKTVCTGYAALIRELCRHASIPCEVVNGYGRTAQGNVGGEGIVNHSWNAVKLDDQWYLCDATWSSGVIDPEQKTFIKEYSDSYFLPSPAIFARNHYPLDTAWLLTVQKPALNEFLHAPLIYRAALDHQAFPVYPETFNVDVGKKEPVHFRFKSHNLIKQAELQIVKGSDITTTSPDVYEYDKDLYAVDYAFPRKGTYVVHLLIDKDYVFTYTVKVSNMKH